MVCLCLGYVLRSWLSFLKLAQEPDVVGKQVTDVFDLMADHAQPFNAQAECESGILFWVVTDAA